MLRGALDDQRHNQLSAGHRPSQTQIDALERGAPKDSLGLVDVQDLEAKTALSDFTLGGSATGVAYSLNPYVGCLHNCTYCFVPKTLHVQRNRWGSYVIAKQNLATVLRQELLDKPMLPVYISTATDPYQSVEAQRRITRGCLSVLAKRDWPVDILTRSPLVLRDLTILRRFSRLRVGMSVPTIDDAARRALEPAAPAIASRLDALRKLADAGLDVYANYAPAYPPTKGTLADVADTFRDAGVRWVNTSPWRYQSEYLAPMWDRLHGTGWDQLARHAADANRQQALRQELAVEMRRVQIPLRTGFFNQPVDLETGKTGETSILRFCPGPAEESGRQA